MVSFAVFHSFALLSICSSYALQSYSANVFGVHKCSSGQNGLSWYQTASPNRRTIWNKLGLGRGWLSRFPPFRYFPNFSTSPKYVLAIEYHVHSWHVSPQLSCGNTCQIWIWFKERNRHFCEIENFAYGEIDEQSFSNPHPWSSCQFPFGSPNISLFG